MEYLWDAVKAVLREKLIAATIYTRKEKINHLNLYLKEAEKEEQFKFKISKQKRCEKNQSTIQ